MGLGLRYEKDGKVYEAIEPFGAKHYCPDLPVSEWLLAVTNFKGNLQFWMVEAVGTGKKECLTVSRKAVHELQRCVVGESGLHDNESPDEFCVNVFNLSQVFLDTDECEAYSFPKVKKEVK